MGTVELVDEKLSDGSDPFGGEVAKVFGEGEDADFLGWWGRVDEEGDGGGVAADGHSVSAWVLGVGVRLS